MALLRPPSGGVCSSLLKPRLGYSPGLGRRDISKHDPCKGLKTAFLWSLCSRTALRPWKRAQANFQRGRVEDSRGTRSIAGICPQCLPDHPKTSAPEQPRKRAPARPTGLSPAQTANSQNQRPTNDDYFKSLSFRVVCYTASLPNTSTDSSRYGKLTVPKAC